MTGGDDDDTYVVAQVGDLVVETPTGGALDTVYAISTTRCPTTSKFWSTRYGDKWHRQ
ncbi:MAG: hypothetical protein R3D89_12180 [Sphingomonadaceae bacterium]